MQITEVVDILWLKNEHIATNKDKTFFLITQLIITTQPEHIKPGSSALHEKKEMRLYKPGNLYYL